MRIFAARLALVCLVLAGPSVPLRAQETTPVKLLAAINRASGAPYRYHVHSVIDRPPTKPHGTPLSSTIDAQGIAHETKDCRELAEIPELRVVTECSDYYFDGARLYEVDMNQTALHAGVQADAFEATLSAIESYAFTDPDFVRRGGRVTAVKDHLIVTAPGGIPMDVGIDPQTMLVQSAVNVKTTGSTIDAFNFTFADQRPLANDVVLPFEIDVRGQLYLRFAQRAIVKEPFEPPEGLIPHFAAGPTTIKMEGSRAGAPPVTTCTIGGVAATCLLDTGNSGMSMSLELAERLGLEPVSAPFEVHGIGSYETGLVKAPALTVGTATYPAARYVVLHDISRLGYDLVLGADFFARTRVTLDYPHRTIMLAAESTPKDDADAIPIRFINFVPVAAVQLAGVDARLALDTGDDSAINLAESFSKAHPGLFKPTGSTAVGGVGGESEEITGNISSVRIGRMTLEHQPIGVTKGLAPTAQGHLGSGFLARFAVTFDYERERATLIAPTARP